MNVLVLNCGSSSIKFQLIDMMGERAIATGLIEQIGEVSGRATMTVSAGERLSVEGNIANHSQGLEQVIEMLRSRQLDHVDAIGHRVVHGGEYYAGPTLIDDEVAERIHELSVLAPLHNPANLEGIRVARDHYPSLPQVAVFDTAFHQSMPRKAYMYALPHELYETDHIRRYGFHGTSHSYVAKAAAAFMQRPLEELNLITLHLGNGASACAIEKGSSVDTSMGMTPLEGLVMGTRSGDLDAAILLHLMRTRKMDAFALDRLLNKQSGLKGLGGNNDLRNLQKEAEEGDEQAALAIDVMIYRIRKYIGAYAAVLGHVDAIVFTGGIGEHAGGVREAACEGLKMMGVDLDRSRNRAYRSGEASVASADSEVDVLVIPTNEELEIARAVIALIEEI